MQWPTLATRIACLIIASTDRETPLADTGSVGQYKPQKTPLRQPADAARLSEVHWVCLPMRDDVQVRGTRRNRADEQCPRTLRGTDSAWGI